MRVVPRGKQEAGVMLSTFSAAMHAEEAVKETSIRSRKKGKTVARGGGGGSY